FSAGDEVHIVPGERRARIRGIQTHKRALEAARPGSRVALNLSGVDKEDLARGMVVVRPGTLAAASLMSARVTLLPGISGDVAHDEPVKLHTGTTEVMARLALLEGAWLEPGTSAWAQLRLAEPVALAVGDRFVIRRPAPPETPGGGGSRAPSAQRGRRDRRRVGRAAAARGSLGRLARAAHGADPRVAAPRGARRPPHGGRGGRSRRPGRGRARRRGRRARGRWPRRAARRRAPGARGVRGAGAARRARPRAGPSPFATAPGRTARGAPFDAWPYPEALQRARRRARRRGSRRRAGERARAPGAPAGADRGAADGVAARARRHRAPAAAASLAGLARGGLRPRPRARRRARRTWRARADRHRGRVPARCGGAI